MRRCAEKRAKMPCVGLRKKTSAKRSPAIVAMVLAACGDVVETTAPVEETASAARSPAAAL
jgi:hypothetical protein